MNIRLVSAGAPRATFCIVLGVLLLTVCAARAQFIHTQPFKREAWQGINYIYQQRHAEAQVALETLAKRYPAQPAPHFMLAANVWWQLKANYINTDYDTRFLAHIDNAISIAEAIVAKNKEDLDAQLFLFASYAFKARWHALRENSLTAARITLKCMPILKFANKHKQTYQEYLFGSGLYLYYREWYAQHKPIYKIFLGWFPPGNMKQGIAELEACTAGDNFVWVEASFFLIDILTDYEQNHPRALQHAERLHATFPENTNVKLLLARCLYLTGKHAEAEKLLLTMQEQFLAAARGRKGALGFAQCPVTTQMMQQVSLYLGLAARAQGHYSGALQNFSNADFYCRANTELEKPLRARIALESGIAYDLLNKRKEALECYQRALTMPHTELVKTKAKECAKAPCK